MKQENRGMAAPLISIVVPVYRVEEYLADCVDSLRSQSYQNIEVILVDDGSPDHCPELCDQYAREDARVRVVHRENGGLSAARNSGIDIAKGEYLLFVDSDDRLHDAEFVQNLYLAAERFGADIVISDTFFWTGDTRRRIYPASAKEPVCFSSEEAFQETCCDHLFGHSAWGRLYRAKLFRELRYPAGILYEDFATFYHLYGASDKIAYVPGAQYDYRIRPGSIMTKPVKPYLLNLADEMLSYASARFRKSSSEANILYCVHAFMVVVQSGDFMERSDRKRAIQSVRRNICNILLERRVSTLFKYKALLLSVSPTICLQVRKRRVKQE